MELALFHGQPNNDKFMLKNLNNVLVFAHVTQYKYHIHLIFICVLVSHKN